MSLKCPLFKVTYACDSLDILDTFWTIKWVIWISYYLWYFYCSTNRWHLGYCHINYLPTKRGFDHHVGYYGAGQDYYTRIITKHKYDFSKDGNPYYIKGNIYSNVRLIF